MTPTGDDCALCGHPTLIRATGELWCAVYGTHEPFQAAPAPPAVEFGACAHIVTSIDELIHGPLGGSTPHGRRLRAVTAA